MAIRLAVILFFASSVSGQTDSCPSDWVMVSDTTCVQFNDQYKLTWSQAQQTCNSFAATLIRFASRSDVDAFSNAATVRSVDGWWSGLNNIGHTDTWTWGGDEQVVPGALAWAVEPTDTHHVENCVSMYIDGTLSDDPCDQRMGYVCTYPFPTGGICAVPFSAYGTQCQYASPLNNATKLLSWADAKAACAAMKTTGQPATLAVFKDISSYENLQITLASLSPTGKRWVGLNDQATERVWTWSDDTIDSDTSFLKWRQYPNQSTTVGCGLVHSNGQMEQADCQQLYHYACKKDINLDLYLEDSEMGCPSPWLRGGRKCYYFSSNVTVTMTAARTFCTSNGGRLLHLQSQDEQDWVAQQTVRLRRGTLWTGLQRSSDGASTWIWDDSSAADPMLTDWNIEPNDNGNYGEDCAYLTSDGVYNDNSCFNRISFVCELETTNQKCPNGWLLWTGSERSSCYFISNSTQSGRANWMEAQNKCKQMASQRSAHLVAITTQDEFNYVTSLFKGQPWAGYWTDLSDARVEGYWQFSARTGETPLTINWAQEPNNQGGHENCVSMYPGGHLNDVTCDAKALVLCEKDVPGLTGTGDARLSSTSMSYTSLLVFLSWVKAILT